LKSAILLLVIGVAIYYYRWCKKYKEEHRVEIYLEKWQKELKKL